MYANTDVKAIGRQYEKSTQAYREEKKKKKAHSDVDTDWHFIFQLTKVEENQEHLTRQQK